MTGNHPGDGERRQRTAGAVYGRRKTKPLRPAQAAAYDELLPALRLDLSRPAPARPGDFFLHSPQTVVLEIGFGGGERLADEARRRPDCGFIGAEPFINGVASLANRIAGLGLTNIRIHDDDATPLLEWLPAESLHRVDLFYPDPWPKKRHWKRRFVTPANLDRIARVLKPGALLRFASDWPEYVEWTLEHCAAHHTFEPPAAQTDIRQPFTDWLRTRYEEKALAAGRQPAYLTFLRRPATP